METAANDTTADEGEMSRPEITQVMNFARLMGEKGLYPVTTARFRASALEALTSILGDEEPCDVQSLLDNLDSIARRWATKRVAKPDTASTYATRARTLLKDFISYQESPLSFKGRNRPAGSRPAKTERVTAEADVVAEEAPAEPKVVSAPDQVRSFPLGDSREIKYVLPGELTAKEAGKFFLHILTMCSDFDPFSPAQAGLFKLIKSDSH
ncbi:MAG: hypothetical protein IT370_36215 [Deltaproteobacteria bacterium]|nr:hypothetical protein [Deltaproteobacteria bacterium]